MPLKQENLNNKSIFLHLAVTRWPLEREPIMNLRHTQTLSEPIGREGRGREERHCRDASMMRCCSSWLLSTLELHQRGCRASRSVNLVIAGPTGAPEAPEACHPRAQWYVELRGRSREPSGKHADAVARLKHSSCIRADSFQGFQPW